MACRTEGDRLEGETERIVSDEGHTLPTHCSLLSNINFITRNLGCQSTREPLTSLCVSSHRAVHTACHARSYKLSLSASPSLMCKETCHRVLSHPTLKMEKKTLLHCFIIKGPSNVFAQGKCSRWNVSSLLGKFRNALYLTALAGWHKREDDNRQCWLLSNEGVGLKICKFPSKVPFSLLFQGRPIEVTSTPPTQCRYSTDDSFQPRSGCHKIQDITLSLL